MDGSAQRARAMNRSSVCQSRIVEADPGGEVRRGDLLHRLRSRFVLDHLLRVPALASRFLFGSDTIRWQPKTAVPGSPLVKRLFWPYLYRLADQTIVVSSPARDLMLSLRIHPEPHLAHPPGGGQRLVVRPSVARKTATRFARPGVPRLPPPSSSSALSCNPGSVLRTCCVRLPRQSSWLVARLRG